MSTIKSDNKFPLSTKGAELEDIVRQAYKAGMEFVKAKHEADRLELLKATQKAMTMNIHDDGNTSETKLKRLAEADKDYIEFLKKLNDAKAKSDHLRIQYESYKNLFEARRSMLSYQKAELKLF